jgi:hypothetical protein
MDNPTRIGVGATALFTLAGIAAPIVSWSVSGPIMLGCAAVAAWGFWPIIGGLASSPTMPHSLERKISLRDAALRLYEEFENSDIGKLMQGPTGTTPDGILDNAGTHIVQHLPVEVRRLPSTKWEPLPRSEVGGLMVCGGATGLRYVEHHDVVYTEPRLTRKDLARLIREYRGDVH